MYHFICNTTLKTTPVPTAHWLSTTPQDERQTRPLFRGAASFDRWLRARFALCTGVCFLLAHTIAQGHAGALRSPTTPDPVRRTGSAGSFGGRRAPAPAASREPRPPPPPRALACWGLSRCAPSARRDDGPPPAPARVDCSWRSLARASFYRGVRRIL